MNINPKKTQKIKRVLVIATSQKTMGGITSVIKAHQLCSFWKEYNIQWLETHIDKSLWSKCWYVLKSFIIYLFIIHKYDLVHIHLSEIPSMLRKLMYFLIAKLFNKKIILHFHSFDPQTTINSRFKIIYRYMFSHSDKVIVLSQSWKNWVKEYLCLSENIIIIYNPSMLPVKKIDFHIRKPIILYAGALNHRKGYADLIRAFHLISKECREWQLVFAGNGEIEEGKTLVRQLNIAEKVSFVGWVANNTKDQLFSSASIFCLPSYAEGFPTAIIDACTYGLPFITTPVGGIPDIIKDDVNGLLFNPGDIVTLSEKLRLLISDNQLRNRLANESLKLSKTTFSLQETDKQIRKLYSELLLY